MYSVVQTLIFSPNLFDIRFDVIKGERAPAGYPVGQEGIYWCHTEHVNLTIDQARAICAKLNANK